MIGIERLIKLRRLGGLPQAPNGPDPQRFGLTRHRIDYFRSEPGEAVFLPQVLGWISLIAFGWVAITTFPNADTRYWWPVVFLFYLPRSGGGTPETQASSVVLATLLVLIIMARSSGLPS